MSRHDVKFIHDMLVKLDGRIDDLADTSARHDENLKEHMKRSEANEEALDELKAHVNRVNGVAAFIGFVGVVAGIWAALK
jgi:predicted phage gp36 major capsid-like protein